MLAEHNVYHGSGHCCTMAVWHPHSGASRYSPLLRSTIIIAILLLLISWTFGPTMAVPPESHQTVQRTFDGGATEIEVVFDDLGTVEDAATITLGNHDYVTQATVDLTLGVHPDGQEAPVDPEVDLGADGSVDWAYDWSLGGPVGLQNEFSGNVEWSEWENNAGTPDTYNVKLPRGADIEEAYLDLDCYAQPSWATQYALSPPTSTERAMESRMVEYDGELFTIWMSYDPAITTGEDSDVVARRFDGTSWSAHEEVSDPWNDESDSLPSAVVFDGELYVFWSRGDGEFTVDSRSEIVFVTYDGEAWSTEQVVSSDMGEGLNGKPRCLAFGGLLVVFWISTDPNVCTHSTSASRDFDVVFTYYDGVVWSEIFELSDPDSTYTDWSVDAAVLDGDLYVVWDRGYYSSGEHLHADIILRVFGDAGWDDEEVLSPSTDAINYMYGGCQDNLPRAANYTNPKTGEEELYVIFSRGTREEQGGDGERVVYKRFSGGSWSDIMQLSYNPPTEIVSDFNPDLMTMGGHLYAIWVTGTKIVETVSGYIVFGNIVIRTFDGEAWSPPMELTPLGNGYDEASHAAIAGYKGKVYASWETWIDDPGKWDIVMRHLEIPDLEVEVEIGGDGRTVWGPGNLDGRVRITISPEDLTGSLEASHSTTDDYGNSYATLPLRITGDVDAWFRLSNLTIRYTYTVQLKLTSVLRTAVEAKVDNSATDIDVTVPISLSTGGPGRMELHDLMVRYYTDHPPTVVTDIEYVEMDEDQAEDERLDLEAYFTDDWDDGELTFEVSLESGGEGLSTTIDGSQLVLGTSVDWNGEAELLVTVYDSTDYYSTEGEPFTVRVLPTNDPPLLDFIPDQHLTAGVEFRLQLTGTDPDGDDLRFSCDSDIVEVDRDGNLSVTMGMDHPKVHVFNVTVTDRYGESAKQQVTFTYEAEVDTISDSLLWLLLLVIIGGTVAGLVVWQRRRNRAELPPEPASEHTEEDLPPWMERDGTQTEVWVDVKGTKSAPHRPAAPLPQPQAPQVALQQAPVAQPQVQQPITQQVLQPVQQQVYPQAQQPAPPPTSADWRPQVQLVACRSCGAPMRPEALFCEGCGKAITDGA